MKSEERKEKSVEGPIPTCGHPSYKWWGNLEERSVIWEEVGLKSLSNKKRGCLKRGSLFFCENSFLGWFMHSFGG